MWSNKLNAFLLAFFIIACNQCLANYLKYQIESELCLSSDFDSHIKLMNESIINTSLILESSTLFPKTCAVRISVSPDIDGLVVNVHNLSFNSNENCDNYIEFSTSPVNKWCNSSEAKNLIIKKTSLDIAFNFKTNESYYFKLVVTPYKNAVSAQRCVSSAPFGCVSSGELICISKDFECDTFNNCPNGFDENHCSEISEPIVKTQSPKVKEVESTQSSITESETPYSIYNITDFCNETSVKEISLKLNSKEGSSPAILQLLPKVSESLNQSDCMLRFTIPPKTWKSTKGLSIGIDSISIASNNNKSCDDFIEIRNPNNKSLTKWCQKTDDIGESFSGTDYIDILFHAGSDSNSSFQLIITEIEEPLNLWIRKFCPSSKNFKCESSQYECLDKTFKCDGHRNCPSGEDETTGCIIPTTTQSPNTTTTTTPSTTTHITTTTVSPNITTTTTPNITTTTTTPNITTTTTTPNITTTTTTPNITTTTVSPNITTTTTESPNPSPHHLSPGIIALITILSIIGVIVILSIGYIIIKRRRNNVGYNALN